MVRNPLTGIGEPVLVGTQVVGAGGGGKRSKAQHMLYNLGLTIDSVPAAELASFSHRHTGSAALGPVDVEYGDDSRGTGTAYGEQDQASFEPRQVRQVRTEGMRAGLSHGASASSGSGSLNADRVADAIAVLEDAALERVIHAKPLPARTTSQPAILTGRLIKKSSRSIQGLTLDSVSGYSSRAPKVLLSG